MGAVIVVSALLSGFVDRTRFPQVAIFLIFGLLLGPHVTGLMDVKLDSELLKAVSTIALVLVLFTDALSLQIPDLRRNARLAAVILGPGTLLAAGAIAACAALLLGLDVASSLMLGGALASTDPVLLRGFLKVKGLPEDARQGLRLESGLNDLVLLPVVIIAMTFAQEGIRASEQIGPMLVKMLAVGPAAGVVVALVAIWLLVRVRRRYQLRRDYESLYSIGVALLAYGVAEAFHASGFLAAFAAGITISAMDVELCECFREYGETTSEMLLLLTFVLLGCSAIWTGLGMLSLPIVAFAVAVVLIRPLTLGVSLAPTKIDRSSLLTISWFGPRGLSSLLLILLPVFAGVPGSQVLFAITGLVVLLSVAVHGISIMAYGRGIAEEDPPEVTVTPADLRARLDAGKPVRLIDVRSSAAYDASPLQVEQAVRIDPAAPRKGMEQIGIGKEQWAALFCT